MNIFDEEIDEKYNVYSFGFSGAPLSQYLKWAEYSINVFNSRISYLTLLRMISMKASNIKNQKGFNFLKIVE